MNIFIMLAILLANIIAVALVYQFVKRLPKMEKLIFIVISFAITYILVLIIYWISGIGIDDQINEAAKDFLTFTFVPVNVILLVPFIATKYNKFKAREIEVNQLIKRVIIIGIIAVIILTLECLYFRNVKKNIKIVNDNLQENSQTENETELNMADDIINTILTNSEEISNSEISNDMMSQNVIE